MKKLKFVTWLDVDGASKLSTKYATHQKKLMVSVTATIYRNRLSQMIEKLKEKQPRLVNRQMTLLLHDNARPHTAKITVTKTQKLELLQSCSRGLPFTPNSIPMKLSKETGFSIKGLNYIPI